MLLRRIAVVEIDRPHKFIYIADGDLMDFGRGGVDKWGCFRGDRLLLLRLRQNK
jgi:hypothetical protein